MTGLPCTGKSTIAAAIAAALPATLLSADPIDAALTAAGVEHRPDIVGYEIMKALARENLVLGLSVVIDAVNPFAFTRAAYVEIAAASSTQVVFIVTECSNAVVHRERVEGRAKPLTWSEVERQIDYYEPFVGEALRLDAVDDHEQNVAAAVGGVRRAQPPHPARCED